MSEKITQLTEKHTALLTRAIDLNRGFRSTSRPDCMIADEVQEAYRTLTLGMKSIALFENAICKQSSCMQAFAQRAADIDRSTAANRITANILLRRHVEDFEVLLTAFTAIVEHLERAMQVLRNAGRKNEENRCELPACCSTPGDISIW